jgi:hypothetical protein
MLQPKEISARSQKSAYAETGDMSSICIPCSGPVRIEAYYDDPWKTPIVGSFVRIEDSKGVLLPGTPGGPTTLGLVNFGSEDGQDVVPSLRPELGTFAYPLAKRGPVKAALVADPSAAASIPALDAAIKAKLDRFTSQMHTALAPWIREWETSGLWGLASTFWEGLSNGASGWLEGEGEFWSGAWAAIKSIPGAVVDGASSAFDYAQALWANRDQIYELAKAFKDGAIEDIERILNALVGLPGELGALLTEVVRKSAEWAGVMNELLRQTNAVEALCAAIFGAILMVPPPFWAEVVGTIGGYIVPEAILAAVFAVIAYFTAGAGAAALTARLAAFTAKTVATLSKAGKAGKVLLRIFSFFDELKDDFVKLAKAVKSNIDEAVDSATDVLTRILRRSGKRVKPPKEIPCFNKPAGVSDADFMEQLQEQENAINNSDISELVARRDMVKQVGTGALRDAAAQRVARQKWLADRAQEIRSTLGVSPIKAEKMAQDEASKLHATHVLDIVAGGDPSVISGLQNASVNSSIGSQWKSRVGSLDGALADHAAKGGIKANVKLKKC